MVDLFPGNPLGATVTGDEITLASQAQGTIMYNNASGTWVVLPVGTAGEVLATGGAAANPSWISGPGVAVGTYSGDGGTSQAITGIGFEPRMIIIYSKPAATGNNEFWVKTSSDTSTAATRIRSAAVQYVISSDGATPGINSIDADGFTVDDGGSDSHPNANGASYVWVAWR